MSTPVGLESYPLEMSADDAAAEPQPPGLNIRVQHQKQTYWCWAAVASTVSYFYAIGSPWSQCALASEAFPTGNCCENGSLKSCNDTFDLDKAFAFTGNLDGSPVNDQVQVADLINAIGIGAPVCIRIEWDNGQGHFVIVRNAMDYGAGGSVAISDPLYGESVHSIADLNGNYLNGNDGRWTDTYYTKG
ncbi:papain-like cysteine protease family protein [Paraburkholderia sp. RL17-337-BIB-A]|uniref:papain-like cysteine protease family protein n=1 Tax=Paraburkholderia sp. RL17-337-BIB-A TaxID=3031636 RepID=UPI0038BDEE6E